MYSPSWSPLPPASRPDPFVSSQCFLKLILAVLGLCCCMGFCLLAANGGCAVVVTQVSHCSGISCWGSQEAGSVLVAGRLSCSSVCGIFLDQGSNPCLLHWQVDFFTEPPGKPLDYQFLNAKNAIKDSLHYIFWKNTWKLGGLMI